MSESANQIIDALREFFKPKATGHGWEKYAPKREQAFVDPHGYRLGVRDELEIKENGEETWLRAHAPWLVDQRRLKASDCFCIEATYASVTRIELGNVVIGLSDTRWFTGQRALLALREHVGRVVTVVQLVAPMSAERHNGQEQVRTITQHGLAWIELNEPIDTEHRSYPAVLF